MSKKIFIFLSALFLGTAKIMAANPETTQKSYWKQLLVALFEHNKDNGYGYSFAGRFLTHATRRVYSLPNPYPLPIKDLKIFYHIVAINVLCDTNSMAIKTAAQVFKKLPPDKAGELAALSKTLISSRVIESQEFSEAIKDLFELVDPKNICGSEVCLKNQS